MKIKPGCMKKNRIVFLILLTWSISTNVIGQYISSVSPLNATINQEVTFTVSGSGLTSGMAFFVADLNNIIELSGGNSTTRYFRGTFQQWQGLKPGVIKNAPGGTTLFSFSVQVNEFPIVTSVVPDDAILGESRTFTIYGTGLTNDMVYYLPDFGSGSVNSNSSTTYKTFTATSSNNAGIKHSEIKDHTGGTVIFNFDVDVYFPTPQNLTATAQGNSQINLSWNSVSNAYQYKLYRSTSPTGSYNPIYTGINTSYSDGSLNSNTTYYYRIQACQQYNQNSCSGQSDYVSASTGTSNNSPSSPYIYNYTSDITVNETVNISVRSGYDPDGDDTKIHVVSPNSDIPDSNPYISSWNSGQYTYSVPITFNQTGTQIVYATTFDINGSGSSVAQHTFVVLPENTNNNPAEPTFVSFPSQVDINQSVDFSILSGIDPNGDQTRIKVWATNSNHAIDNPYYSNFENGGHQFTVPLTFVQEGTQTVYCQTIDANANASSTISRSLSAINGTTTITEVIIGNLTFTAANIVETQTNVFTLSGNVQANDIVHFTGTVTIDLGDLSVSGNGRVYLTNIPNFSSDVDLYNGVFSYDVPNNTSELIAVGIDEANELLSMANLPVYIDNIEVLGDGINIVGEVKFPELFGFIRGEVTQLRITQSQGLELIGTISLAEIQSTGFTLKNINFAFNTIDDEFSGSGEIETSLFEAGANVSIVSTGIDEVGMFLSLTNPKPLGTTGLALSGLNGNISNIQSHPNPPMIITIGASLTPVGVPTDIVEFSDVSLTYQFGTSLSGNGIFMVLGTETASAGFEVREGLFKINAQIDFYSVVNAAIEAGIVANQNNSIDVFARFTAAVTIPQLDFGFPFGWVSTGLNAGLSLPLTVADFDNVLFNSTLSGKGELLQEYKFSYLLTYSDGTIHKEFAKNFSLFNQDVFRGDGTIKLEYLSPSRQLSDWNSHEYNRFEGQSLIINPENYRNSRDVSNNLIQDFILPNTIETLVVRVVLEDNSAVPEVYLTTPGGEIINPDNIDDFDNAIYTLNDDNNGAYYTIKNAAAGVWLITMVDNGVNHLADIFGTNNEPGIIINGIQKTGNSVEVSWVDYNPDYNGQISLFYDYDNDGIDGSLIVSGISEDDATDSYTFDVSDFNTGVYYVYAIMFDESGVPVTSYSLDPFDIQGNIAAPTNLSYSINNDGNIEFTWDELTDGNIYNYLLYYQQDEPVSFGSQNINTGTDVSSYIFTNNNAEHIVQYMIVAQNSVGSLGSASNKLEIDLAVYQTMYMNAGWNLIGLNVEPFDLSAENAFSSINDKLIQVKDETRSYDPNLPGFLNTLDTIENGKGYWIKLSQPAQLMQRGSEISLASMQIPLNQGWNLISFPAQYTQDIEQALISISDKIIQVKNINQSYDPALPSFLNTLHVLTPGEGYWIKVNQNCILTY
jgi:hypothetical protein